MIIAVIGIASIILLIRKTDSFFNPQFWAEDGTIFFLQQYEDGISSIIQPYSGYLHLLPRLIALFADLFFNYSVIPTVYNFSCYIVTMFVITSLFSPRLKIDNKALYALSLVLIPHFELLIALLGQEESWKTTLAATALILIFFLHYQLDFIINLLITIGGSIANLLER